MTSRSSPVFSLSSGRHDDASQVPCVISPTFDERYQAWAEAEAAIATATAQGVIHDADRLAALCVDASMKHRLLWADIQGPDVASPMQPVAAPAQATRAAAAADHLPRYGEIRNVEETAMYTTDTSLHDLRDQVMADLRRDRARTRWIGFAALAAGMGAVALYMSMF